MTCRVFLVGECNAPPDEVVARTREKYREAFALVTGREL